MTATAAWDALHQQARHQLMYPSEHVVRFLSAVKKPHGKHAIDIGCGNGRHSVLMLDYGLHVEGVDVSATAVAAAAARDFDSESSVGLPLAVSEASMTGLPFDERFDVAVSYGVFYYGLLADHAQAVMEMHRVLRPGGQGFVCVRTPTDWRATTPAALKGEPEEGMVMHFVYEEDIASLYGVFSEVTYELTETTTGDRSRTSSDWLITVTK